MKEQGKSQLKGSILLLLTAMIWGGGFVAQSEGMNYIGPFTMQACRFLLSGLILLPVIALCDARGKSEHRPVSSAEKRHLLLCGCICGVLLCVASSFQQFGLLQYNLNNVPVGKSGFITALYILIVPLFGLFLHQRVGKNIWFGIALALVGLYFLCMTGGLGSISLGDLLTLICAIVFAMHIQYVDRVGGGVDCVRMSCIQFFVTSLIAGIGMLLFETPSWDAIKSCWIPIAYAGILSGGAAYTLQIVGQQYTEPTVASLLLSLESVFSALFGCLLIPEQKLTSRELIGCVLMFLAIVLAQLPERKASAKR